MNLTPQENSLIGESHPEVLERMDTTQLKELQTRLRHAREKNLTCCGVRVRPAWRPKVPAALFSPRVRSAVRRSRPSTRHWRGWVHASRRWATPSSDAV